MEHLKIIYWSDSLVTLRWIRGDASRRKSFVRNQVETIQGVFEKEWWNHCTEIQNPADLASSAQTLVSSQPWWYGTEWLSEEKESKWPDSTEQEKQDSFIQEKIEAESRGAVFNIIAAIATSTDGISIAFQHGIDFYGEPLGFLCSPTDAEDERVIQD